MKNINKKGLTLIELLGVIVVLGIIATISFVSISGVINNSRKDALAENGNAMVEGVELFVSERLLLNGDLSGITTSNEIFYDDDTTPTLLYINLQYLIDEGYLDADDFEGNVGQVAINLAEDTTNGTTNKIVFVAYEEGDFIIFEGNTTTLAEVTRLGRDEVVEGTLYTDNDGIMTDVEPTA